VTPGGAERLTPTQFPFWNFPAFSRRKMLTTGIADGGGTDGYAVRFSKVEFRRPEATSCHWLCSLPGAQALPKLRWQTAGRTLFLV
jgi:hypothetical protein